VNGKEFCPTVVWPLSPVWLLEPLLVDLELLEVKTRNKGANVVNEYVQVFTDSSKDQTESIGSAVAVYG